MNSSTSSSLQQSISSKNEISLGPYSIIFEGDDQLKKQHVAINVEKEIFNFKSEIQMLMRLQDTQRVSWLHLECSYNQFSSPLISKKLRIRKEGESQTQHYCCDSGLASLDHRENPQQFRRP